MITLFNTPQNVDNTSNAKCETTVHFMNEKREYLKARTNELARNSKNKKHQRPV
jgi:hypothetical protein